MSSLISIPNTSKWTLFHNKIDAWWSVDACCYSWSWTPIHCVCWCSPWIAPRSGRTWPPPAFCYRANKKQKKKSAHYFVHLDWFFCISSVQIPIQRWFMNICYLFFVSFYIRWYGEIRYAGRIKIAESTSESKKMHLWCGYQSWKASESVMLQLNDFFAQHT